MSDTRTTRELRPLSLGGILDEGFRIYRANFKTLCLAVLVVVIPVTVLDVTLRGLALEDAFDPTPPADQATSSTAALVGFWLPLVVLVLLAAVATAACVRAVAVAYLGRGNETTWQASLRFALRKAGPLLAATLLTLLAVGAGFLAFVVPGIYLLVRLAVVTPALLVEDIPAPDALRRSWWLTDGRWWGTFAVVAAAALVVVAFGGLLQLAIIAPLFGETRDELLGGVLTGVGQIVSQTLTVPLQAAVLTVLYFDLRVRKEGFDRGEPVSEPLPEPQP